MCMYSAHGVQTRGWLLFSGALPERPSAGMADQHVPSWVVWSFVWFPSVSGLVSRGLLHAALRWDP